MSEEFKKSVLENLVDSDREIHFCCSGDISIISPKLSVGGQSAFQLPLIAKTDASYQKKLVVYHEDQQKLTASINAKKVLCQTN